MDELPNIPPNSPWWMVALGVIPACLPIAIGLLRFFTERRNGVANEAKRIDAERAMLSQDQQRLFDQMRGQLEWQNGRISELERDRDRGWNLARAWRNECDAVRSAFQGFFYEANTGRKFAYPELPSLETLLAQPIKKDTK